MNPAAFLKTTATLGYAHNELDRLANHRDDAAFIDALKSEDSARTLLVTQDSVLVQHNSETLNPWFSFAEAAALGSTAETVFLGLNNSGAAFGSLLNGGGDELSSRSNVSLHNLRALAVDQSVSAADLGAIAQAKALLHWHKAHRFCSNCGAPSKVSGAGWRRECPACGAQHFPRTDPVVIMLATKGDQCLLGRQPRFPAGMYSCLAGFLEPGETIEAAVARELHEEAGITVGRVTYLGSQPWPFPASLMIGCLAEATSTLVEIDDQELEDARWFSRDEVLTMLDGTHPDGLLCPTQMAIAYHIVRAWVSGAP
jgi:NAD+ diphosphatase